MKIFIPFVMSLLFLPTNDCGASDTDEESAAATRLIFNAIEKDKDLQLFLESGADLQDIKIKGYPTLAHALKQNNKKAIDVLLPKVDLGFVWKDGTYLHEVMRKKDLPLINDFMKVYSDQKKLGEVVDIQDSEGNTPSHLTAIYLLESLTNVPLVEDIKKILRELKEAKGHLTIENQASQTVTGLLELAQERVTRHRRLTLGWSEMHIRMRGRDMLLIEENVDQMWAAYNDDPLGINAPNLKGTTPLHIVAFKYVKFAKQERKQDAEDCLKLLRSMQENDGLVDLENQAGDSVTKILAQMQP